MNAKKLTGDWGEACVAAYLRRNGYRIEASQFRCRMGEVDLIASRDGVLCFVEVKTRTNLSVGLPREYVTRQNRAWTAAGICQPFQTAAHSHCGGTVSDALCIGLSGSF